MKAKSSDQVIKLITVSLGAIYFVLLKPFYIRAYEVPDYFAYYDMGHKQYPAMDGFSSLFIKIASYSIQYYEILHYAMLGLLTSAIVVINFAFISICKNTLPRICFLLFSFSMASWYYFDGKVFYEFPFIAFNFAIVLWLTAPLIATSPPPLTQWSKNSFHRFTEDSDPPINNFRLLLACLFAGLCISWKSHAIFPIFGLLGLILIRQPRFLRAVLPSLIFYLALFFLGYLVGNFHLIDQTQNTLSGIKGYPGQVEILHYLFNDYRTVWDHINFFSFNTSVFNVPAAFILLFICPLFMKRGLAILGLNIFITACFLITIHLRSRGYPWHGFPFSLYILAFVFFFLANRPNISLSLWGYAPFIAALGLQLYSLYIVYLPAQSSSFHATTQSIEIIQNNSATINEAVTEIISANGPKYKLNLYPKRMDKDKQAPIDKYNQPILNKLLENQCRPCEDGYEIFIVPFPLFSLSSFPLKLDGTEQLISYPDFLIGIKSYLNKPL
jgi:hypothetical protein